MEPVKVTPEENQVSESHEAATRYSRMATDIGNLQLQIRELEAEVETLFIKMRNARIDYLKSKKAETAAHPKEATEPKGVTQ